jgi:phosphoribosylamine--glycine ligase
MIYFFITNTGEALPIAKRLKEEGHQVTTYIHNRAFRSNYDGMIAKLEMRQVVAQARQADLVVFDMVRPVENKDDRALQKMFGVKGNDLFGPIADSLRGRGIDCLGAASFAGNIELDRDAGADLAKKVGLGMPQAESFNSLAEGIRFLKSHRSSRWVFKPYENQDLDLTYVECFPGELIDLMGGQFKKRLPAGVDFLLQEVIDGVEISTEAWWTGKKWTWFNHTIEDKRLMTGDLGPRIGSANNVVWLKHKKGLLVDVFERLTPVIKKAGYIGPIDVNCIVGSKDKRPYFLEWTPRFGYDALYCLLELVDGKLSDFFGYVAGLTKKGPKAKPGYASSVRVSVSPYPYEVKELLENAKDVVIGGDLTGLWLEDVYQDGKEIKCAGSDGVVGVLARHGNTLGGSVKNVYKQAEEVKIAGYAQWRTDLGFRARNALKQLSDMNIVVD